MFWLGFVTGAGLVTVVGVIGMIWSYAASSVQVHDKAAQRPAAHARWRR